MHSDVKERNILVRRDMHSSSAILVDLGVSKVFSTDESGVESLSPETFFFSTKKYTRESRQELLGKKLARSQIEQMFPDHDLYAFGLLIENALDNLPLKNTL